VGVKRQTRKPITFAELNLIDIRKLKVEHCQPYPLETASASIMLAYISAGLAFSRPKFSDARGGINSIHHAAILW
jgi:hypothetical protein